MALTYEEALAEVKKLPQGEEILGHVLEKVHSVNNEAKNLRIKAKEYENILSTHKEKLKAHGIDPDSDIDEQLEKMRSKEGMKPESDFNKVMKELDKFKKEVSEWKGTAEKREADLLMEKAKNAFAPILSDHFGKQASALLELALLKGQIVVKDGVPGVLYNDDFVPLRTEKGPNAVDMLRKIYPEFAITKQIPGSKKPDGRAPITGEESEKTMTRAEHDILGQKNPKAAMDFIKAGGVLVDE